MKIKRYLFLSLYYGFAYHLPRKTFPLLGRLGRWARYSCCKHIFKQIGKNVNIERHANFGSGKDVIIGDNSGLGLNCVVPSNIEIGNNVMMGPNCIILAQNHKFDRVDIPMIQQGNTPPEKTIIGDDVWIGRDVRITPGRIIADGSIIALGCVLTKNFPPFSIVGGCPSKLIRSRLDQK